MTTADHSSCQKQRPISDGSTAAGAPHTWLRSPTHRAWLLAQALRLLDFFRASLDETGHFVELDDDGQPVRAGGASQPASAQSLLTVARVVHSYALGELLGVPGCGLIVDRGLDVLWSEHRDAKAGGYFQAVDATGPVDSTKSAYNHAFVLLGASSALAAGHDARHLYDDVRAVIDEHFWSEEDGASRESFTGNWDELESYRGANSNMHMCEAFLGAADSTGDEALADRASRIAGFSSTVTPARAAGCSPNTTIRRGSPGSVTTMTGWPTRSGPTA
jgi:mannose/cellobiose epimerase-like protein (N-acyl-D-glucosamine 2-epimerase family)